MRNISFMLTIPQTRAQKKTVTRRDGWRFLKVGDRLMACEKCQGLGKGGKIVHIGEIEVTEVRQERLDRIVTSPAYGRNEMYREGFAGMRPKDFLVMFIKTHKGVTADSIITRIRFKYI